MSHLENPSTPHKDPGDGMNNLRRGPLPNKLRTPSPYILTRRMFHLS